MGLWGDFIGKLSDDVFGGINDWLGDLTGATPMPDDMNTFEDFYKYTKTDPIDQVSEDITEDVEGYKEDIKDLDKIVRGSDGNFYYSDDLDEAGNPLDGSVPVANFTDIVERAKALNGGFMTYQEWLDAGNGQYIDPQQALDEYKQQVLNYENRDRDSQENDALNFAARILGLTDENGNGSLEDEYQAMMGGFRETIESGGQGYTDAQRLAIDRNTQRTAANMQAGAQKLVDQILGQTGGSSTRAMAAADAKMNEISDYMIQAGAQQVQDELELKKTQLQSAMQMELGLAQQMGTLTLDYVKQVDSEYLTLFQGYAQNLNNVLAVNGQSIDMYTADMNTVAEAAQATYNGLMVELGVEQMAIDSAWQSLDAELNRLLANANLELAAFQTTIDQATIDLAYQQLEESKFGFDDFLIEIAFPIALAVAFPPAAPAAAALTAGNIAEHFVNATY